MTKFHKYNVPSKGTSNWHEPLNQNFRAIDEDIEVRDTETNLGEYSPVDGSKFLATDTGRVFVGDGDSWTPMRPVGDRGSPDIVCYEENSNSYAETAATTHTGDDVLDAAQKAVDDRLPGSGGNISILFKPGHYVVNNRLQLTGDAAKNTNRIVITSEGSADGAYFETKNLSGGTVIKIDPQAGDTAQDRIFGVYIGDIGLDHRDDPGNTAGGAGSASRDEDAIYVNDARDVHLKRLSIQGYGHGLRLRNIWQGEVDYLVCRTCGSNADDKSPIRIGTGQTNGSPGWWNNAVHNAVNHVQIRHLQGGPQSKGDAIITVATPEVGGKKGRIRSLGILHPNVECSGSKFLKSHGNAWISISNCQVKEPAPCIDQRGGRTAISGGIVENPHQVLRCRGGHASITGLDVSSTPESKPLVDFQGGWLNIGNVRTYGGQNAVRANAANVVNVAGLHAQQTDESAVYLQNVGMASVGNVVAKQTNVVDDAGESPIQLVNNGPTSVTNVQASVPSGASAGTVITDEFGSGPLDTAAVVPGANLSRPLSADSKTTFVRSKGRATIGGDSTSTSVSHNLVAAPSLGDISVTPVSPLGNASSWYVTDVGGDSFSVTLDATPGRAVTFGWQAEL